MMMVRLHSKFLTVSQLSNLRIHTNSEKKLARLQGLIAWEEHK